MNSKVPAWIAVLLWIGAVLDIANGIEMFFFPSAWFFKLVPGVPETGPYNMHLVADGGTFFLAVGVGLVFAALNPRRNAVAVVVAAVAGVMHSALHIYSHAAGLLSLEHLTTEVLGIYIPTILLIAIAVVLYREPDQPRAAAPSKAA
jgi:predicted anti-sigma-YlaC factor YlaD